MRRDCAPDNGKPEGTTPDLNRTPIERMLDALQQLHASFPAVQQANASFPTMALPVHYSATQTGRILLLQVCPGSRLTPLGVKEGHRQKQRQLDARSRDDTRASNHVLPEPNGVH